MTQLLELIPLALIILSTLGLRYAWRRSNSLGLVLRLSSWAMFIGASIFWSRIRGPEYGLSFSLFCFALSAYIVAYTFRHKRDESRQTKSVPYKSFTLNVKSWLGTLPGFLLFGPVSLIACACISLALGKLLPISFANQVLLATFLFPILYGLCSYWLCIGQERLKKTGILVVGALASAAYLSL